MITQSRDLPQHRTRRGSGGYCAPRGGEARTLPSIHRRLSPGDRTTAEVPARGQRAPHEAGRHGRHASAECWGRFEPDSRTLTTREYPRPVGEDLLNLAAVWTLEQSG